LADGEGEVAGGLGAAGDADLVAALAVAEGDELVPGVGLTGEEGRAVSALGLAGALGTEERAAAGDADVGDDVDEVGGGEAGGVAFGVAVDEVDASGVGREGGGVGVGDGGADEEVADAIAVDVDGGGERERAELVVVGLAGQGEVGGGEQAVGGPGGDVPEDRDGAGLAATFQKIETAPA
jgi:hypothetical protein